MVDTPPQTDTYSTALDIFDRTHPLRVDVDENLKVTGTFTPAPGSTQDVHVTNTPTVVETNLDKNFGTWDYYSGTSGTVVVSAGQRILGIGTHATTAGSFTINGGSSIPVPAGVSVNIEPLGNLTAPTIVFIGTDSYFIEVVS